MKRIFVFAVSALLLILSCHPKDKSGDQGRSKKSGMLLPGRLALAALPPSPLSAPVDKAISLAQEKLRSGTGRAEDWTRLARLFIKKARQSSDSSLYRQADDALSRSLAAESGNLPALEARGVVLLSAHRFTEARTLGEEIVRRAPGSAVGYGVVGDAEVELGQYDEAVRSYQKMVDAHPDQTSYSRAAWMRWLTGDTEGALELMRLAIDAGSARDREAWAWCTSELGRLLLLSGKPMLARAEFERALGRLNDYAPAWLGLGQSLAAEGRLDDALVALRRSVAANPTVAARWALSDTLLASKQQGEAAFVEAALEESGERDDPRTFSLFLSTRNKNAPRALSLARTEQATRDDIYTEDAFGWALYRTGDLAAADAAAQEALRLGTPDARMLFHAGAIARARGDRRRSDDALRKAVALNPFFDREDAATARAWLASP